MNSLPTKQAMYVLAASLPYLSTRGLRLIVTACRAVVYSAAQFEDIVAGASIYNFTVEEIMVMKRAIRMSGISPVLIHEVATLALYAKWHKTWDEFKRVHPEYQYVMV